MAQQSQSGPTFRPSVYALIDLRTRAQRADDPLAPLAARICSILKSYKNSSFNIRSLIEILYEFAVEMIEKNAETDARELAVLNEIESTLIPYQWDTPHSRNVAAQAEQYKTYFSRRLDLLHVIGTVTESDYVYVAGFA